MASKAIQGAVLIIIAEVIFTVIQSTVKFLSGSLPITHMVFMRYIMGPALLIPYFLFFSKFKFQINNKPMLFIRVVSGVTAMVCYFLALKHTDIGKAALIFHLSAMWVIIFSMLVYKERPTRPTLIAMPFTFLGLYFVLRPTEFGGLNIGDVYALVASVFNAGVILSLKQLRNSKNKSESVVLATYFLSSMIMAGPFVHHWEMPSVPQWGLLVFIGAIGIVGQLLMTYGFKYTPASVAGSVTLSNVPMMAISGAIFFNQIPDLLGIIGGSIIFISLIVITRYQ